MPAKKEYKSDEVSCEVGGLSFQPHNAPTLFARIVPVTICVKKGALAHIISAFSEKSNFSFSSDGVKVLNLINCTILAVTDKKEYYRLVILGEMD